MRGGLYPGTVGIFSVEQAELPTDKNYTHKEALCRGHTNKKCRHIDFKRDHGTTLPCTSPGATRRYVEIFMRGLCMAFISVLVTSQRSMLPRDYRERPVAFGTTSRKCKLHRVANGPNLLMADCLMSSNCCASEILKRCPESEMRWNASLYVSVNQSALGLPGRLRDCVLGVIASVFGVTCASGSEGRARRIWPNSLHFALRHCQRNVQIYIHSRFEQSRTFLHWSGSCLYAWMEFSRFCVKICCERHLT